MSAALSRGWRKGLRTVVQVAAGGALTALVTAIAGGLPPKTQALVMGAWIAFVAFAQNWAETAGKIPTILPTPGLVVGPDVVVATVEAVADDAGDIVGDVTDTAGDVVGTVVGAVVPEDDEHGGVPLAVLILAGLVLVLIFGLGLCGDALFDDEDETDDLGYRSELVTDHRRGDNGSGECSGSDGSCSDDDLSPSFDQSPVWICLPGSTCNGPQQEGNT